MSSDDLKSGLFLYTKEYGWSSANSNANQKISKLSKSESHFPLFSKINSNDTLKELEIVKTNSQESSKKIKCWDYVESKCRFPRMIQSRSLLRDELEMLKINMSIFEKLECLREPQLKKNQPVKVKKKIIRKVFGKSKEVNFLKFCSDQKAQDLTNEIEG